MFNLNAQIGFVLTAVAADLMTLRVRNTPTLWRRELISTDDACDDQRLFGAFVDIERVSSDLSIPAVRAGVMGGAPWGKILEATMCGPFE